MVLEKTRIEFGDLFALDQLAIAVAHHDNPVGRRRNRPIQRWQIVGGKRDAPALAFGRPQAGGPLLVRPLTRLGALAPFFRLAPLCFRLNDLPAVNEILIGGERHPPGLVVAVPTGEGHLADFLDQLARIGRLDAKPFSVDAKIGAEDRLEREGIPALRIGIRIDTGLFLCQPAINTAARRRTGNDPRLPPVTPASTRKRLAKPLHRHPVERKRDSGAVVVLRGVLANVVTVDHPIAFQLRCPRNARQLEKMQRIKGMIETRQKRRRGGLSY